MAVLHHAGYMCQYMCLSGLRQPGRHTVAAVQGAAAPRGAATANHSRLGRSLRFRPRNGRDSGRLGRGPDGARWRARADGVPLRYRR
ncbi:MAG: hypothetical protein ABW298_17615 [Candidatus Binatia bacterium]